MLECNCGLRLPVKVFPFYCACGTQWLDRQNVAPCKSPRPMRLPGDPLPRRHSHWPELHLYPANHTRGWRPAAAKTFYDNWCTGIPSYNCSCAANWKSYTATNLPDFSSAKAFFEWSVTSHNYVSQHHANKPTISTIEAAGLYLAPWITRRPRAIVTLALGEHQRVLDITLPLMLEYADRVGAELHVIDSNLRPEYPMANKWRVANYAANYDQTLYLDSDVLISPNAPDIFAAVPKGFAVRDERPDYHHDWYSQETSDLYASQGVSHTLQHCANGGVMLMTPETLDLYWEPSGTYPQLWCTDQHWLSYRIETSGHEVTWLDDRWNWGFIRIDWWRGLADAWFVHLNGSRPLSYRLELAERIKAQNYEKFLPPQNAGWAPKHD